MPLRFGRRGIASGGEPFVNFFNRRAKLGELHEADENANRVVRLSAAKLTLPLSPWNDNASAYFRGMLLSAENQYFRAPR